MSTHPALINWIAEFLSNRLQRTRVGQIYSALKQIKTGVSQRTILGPLLLHIMVNDLRLDREQPSGERRDRRKHIKKRNTPTFRSCEVLV
jgi:hypothetical protein